MKPQTLCSLLNPRGLEQYLKHGNTLMETHNKNFGPIAALNPYIISFKSHINLIRRRYNPEVCKKRLSPEPFLSSNRKDISPYKQVLFLGISNNSISLTEITMLFHFILISAPPLSSMTLTLL